MVLESLTGTIASSGTLSSKLNETLTARPFVKWVGGKSQLLPALVENFPAELKAGLLRTYIEPFAGGGSVFLHVAQNFRLDRFIIADNNVDLILAYWIVRDRVGQLIIALHELHQRYLKLGDEKREAYYYKVRSKFNANKCKIDLTEFSQDWVDRTAQLIFLNKTCFNGLFRVNSSGLFNVAFGKYENPKINDPDNLVEVSHVLRRAEVILCDFEDVLRFVDNGAFLYLDPPYRPITPTANFTSYSATTFTALDQQRLALFCQNIDRLGGKVLLSNSDPGNEDPDDTFFEQTYSNFNIVKTTANRMINCRSDRRGKISELLIMNYENGQR